MASDVKNPRHLQESLVSAGLKPALSFLISFLVSWILAHIHRRKGSRDELFLQYNYGGWKGKTWWFVAGPVEMTKCPR